MGKAGEYVWALKRNEFDTKFESFPTREEAVIAGFNMTKNHASYYTGRLIEFHLASCMDPMPMIRKFEQEAIQAGVPYREVVNYVNSFDEDDLEELTKEMRGVARDIFSPLLAVADINWHWHEEFEEGQEGSPLLAENQKLKKAIDEQNRKMCELYAKVEWYEHEKGKQDES